MNIPPLCRVGPTIYPNHDWGVMGVCAHCGAQLPKASLLLSQEEVAALIASHPSVIGRLHAKPEDQLSVTVENGIWSVEKP